MFREFLLLSSVLEHHLLNHLTFYNNSHNMSQDSTRLLDNIDSEERRLPPGNIYYVMPYHEPFMLLYAFVGSLTCSFLSDSLSTSTSAILWVTYVVSCAVMIVFHPEVCCERKKIDEEGKEVTLRCPVIGFKACEVPADLEGIKNGLYDEGDRTDLRLHDGYRYGYARIRI